MTPREASRFRTPGPLGQSQSAVGARLPGPLGLHPVIFAGPNLQTQATKKLTMPKPAHDSSTKLVRDVPWDLFKQETPAVSDVEQGQLSNCPLAALLSALANTPKGRAHIKSLVTQPSATVETDVSGVASALDSTPPGNKITTKYYFTVRLVLQRRFTLVG